MKALLALLLACAPAGAAAARVTEPPDGALFPADLRAPEFRWEDGGAGKKPWNLRITFASKKPEMRFVSDAPRWTPSRADWELIKAASLGSPATFEVAGARATFTTSKDPVGAPIFFRAVPNPFPDVSDFVRVKWKLAWLSSYDPPKTAMTGQRRCFNCHTSSNDGRSFGFEVNPEDNQSDRTAYLHFRDPGKAVVLRWRDYFDWNVFLPRAERDKNQATLSTISPDGSFIVTGAASLMNIAFTPCKDMISYSFPTKGIIAWRSAKTKAIAPLPGADDPKRVHIPGSWSADGRFVYYFGAPITPQYEKINLQAPGEKENQAAKTQGWRELDRIYPMKFDVFRVPFNGGKGGAPEPVKGASANGRSNFFPRASPDGKWLAYVQAANGALTLREDSDLYIVPAEGGKARRLGSNSGRADSWHAWSPNGRWLTFSSKRNGRQTDLLLTHIDDEGRDSPPITLTFLRDEDGLSANIPEFFNIKPGVLETIEPRLPEWIYRLLRRWDEWRGR
ncbi:MAG: PD40 domain-containing protein [Elusimicrobia bacterium]|nr:PD40 domain-containing protein [Elusimicrobiota bacterium]